MWHITTMRRSHWRRHRDMEDSRETESSACDDIWVILIVGYVCYSTITGASSHCSAVMLFDLHVAASERSHRVYEWIASQGRRGGHNSPGAGSLLRRRMTAGDAKCLLGPPKIPNTVHFLPKDLTFEHGGAKLAFCPGRSLTSLHPCCKLITAWHYICEPDSCAVWVSYRQKKRPLQESNQLIGIKMPTSVLSRNIWFVIPISRREMPAFPPADAHAIIDYFISGSTNKAPHLMKRRNVFD